MYAALLAERTLGVTGVVLQDTDERRLEVVPQVLRRVALLDAAGRDRELVCRNGLPWRTG